MGILKRFLDHKHFRLFLVGIVALLFLPSLWQGIMADDYIHRATFVGAKDLFPPSTKPIMELFNFAGEDYKKLQQLKEIGVAPWWALPKLQMAFWRPLSSATHWLDYKLWPDKFPLMHLHSILWFLALILLLSVFFQKLIEKNWYANLATFAFAVFPGFAFPVAWLANRNAIIATFFGVMTLLFFHLWRKEGWRWGAWLTPFTLLLSLLSAEAGLATCAYLFSYALFLDQGRWYQRLLRLAPAAVVVVGWRIIYVTLGFHCHGTSLYIDPLRDPIRFLFALVEKIPLFLVGQWAWPSPSLYPIVNPSAQMAIWLWAVGIMLFLLFLLLPMRKDPLSRFLGLSMLLCLIPISATMPHERLLFFSSIGSMGLIAIFVQGYIEKASWLAEGKLWKKIAKFSLGYFLVYRIAISPLIVPATILSMANFQGLLDGQANTITQHDIKKKDTVVLVNSPDFFIISIHPLQKVMDGHPFARYMRVLAPANSPVLVTRTDKQTLLISPEKGYLHGYDRGFRSPDHPMKAGQIIKLPGLTITVKTIDKTGRPMKVSFRFDRPLEDKRLRFFRAKDKDGYIPFTIPSIGKSTKLPKARLF